MFRRLWKTLLNRYDLRRHIAWNWQSVDGSMTKAPLGWEKTGRNPTDRGKLGVKRSILTDRRGMPLGVTVSGDNTHDVKLLFESLDSIPIRHPTSRRGRRQHLCGDLAYDSERDRRRLRRGGYMPHIRSRGAEIVAKRTAGKRARCWVVERTASWLNRYRRILVRWEKKSANYLGLLHLACAHVLWRNC